MWNISTCRLKTIILAFFCIYSSEIRQKRNLDAQVVTTLLKITESGKSQCPNVVSVQGSIMGCTDTPADEKGLGLVHEAKGDESEVHRPRFLYMGCLLKQVHRQCVSGGLGQRVEWGASNH